MSHVFHFDFDKGNINNSEYIYKYVPDSEERKFLTNGMSCYNVIYEVILKISTNTLKLILPNFIPLN